jgi:hypothetical protein
MTGDKSMSKQDDLVLDIVNICKRNGIESFQAVQVFADPTILGKVVHDLETAESVPQQFKNEVQ